MASIIGATIYHVMVSAFFILLNKISQKEDIILGAECNIRNHKLSRTVGWLSNTVLLRQFVTPQERVKEFINLCSTQIIESMNYMAYPIEKVLLEVDRSIDSFGSLYVNHLNLSDSSSEIFENFKPIHSKDGLPYFDLDFFLFEYSNGIDVTLRYKEELFEQGNIESLSKQFIDILVSMNINVDQKISDLNTFGARQ